MDNHFVTSITLYNYNVTTVYALNTNIKPKKVHHEIEIAARMTHTVLGFLCSSTLYIFKLQRPESP